MKFTDIWYFCNPNLAQIVVVCWCDHKIPFTLAKPPRKNSQDQFFFLKMHHKMQLQTWLGLFGTAWFHLGL